MAYGVIYGLHDPQTGELRYIGQTIQLISKRLTAHLTPSCLRKHTYAARWLHGLVQRGLIPSTSLIAEAKDQDELDRLEIEHIAQARKNGVRLVNLSDGGAGSAGHLVSPEARARIAAKQLGVPKPKHTDTWKAEMSLRMLGRNTNTPEHMAKLAALKIGIPRSEVTKAKISAAKKGKKLSLEHRAKISLALKGREQPHLQCCKGDTHPAYRQDIFTEDILKRLAEGQTKVDVAKALGVSPTFVHRRLNQAGLTGESRPKGKRKAWNKGRTLTEEHRKNLSLAKQEKR